MGGGLDLPHHVVELAVLVNMHLVLLALQLVDLDGQSVPFGCAAGRAEVDLVGRQRRAARGASARVTDPADLQGDAGLLAGVEIDEP
jgi:hypothetical protein